MGEKGPETGVVGGVPVTPGGGGGGATPPVPTTSSSGQGGYSLADDPNNPGDPSVPWTDSLGHFHPGKPHKGPLT